MFPVFNDSSTGKKKKKQEAIGERAGEKCPEHGVKVLTASVITKSNTESECC